VRGVRHPVLRTATRLLAAVVLLGAGAPAARAEPDGPLSALSETEWHLLPPGTASLVLAHPFVHADGFEAVVGGATWRADTDYRVDGTRGLWYPLRPLGDASATVVAVRLRYDFDPAVVPPDEELHAVRGPPTPADPTAPATASPQPAPYAAAAAAGDPLDDLLVSGSKSVRMSSGNRRDLSVDQNLRLDISGRLTETISVRAALSDDNLPVVPEGNTEELRDIDRVRVELAAPRWNAVLGDFVAERGGTAFGNYRRKLQGFTLEARPGFAGVAALAGSPRGLYRTIQLRGEEANQGPYQLGAGGAGVFLVAGSERVRLDGQPMTRGADRDYVVDYVRGTVTFTYRRLITADSEIVVEFEEGEGPYSRTVAGGQAEAAADVGFLGDRTAALTLRLVRERDDPTRLRTGELSEADRATLAAAGDAPAVASGLTAVAAGAGDYRLETIGGVQVAVRDTLAGDYLVEFYDVGAGLGDYGVASLTALGATVYAYRGPGGGSFRIGRLLPAPSSQRLATFLATLGDPLRPLVAVEWDASSRDANVLSGRDDADDAGGALRAALDLGSRAWRPGGRSVGVVALQASHEDLGARFAPFQLARDLFRYDRWGLGDRARRAGFLRERDVESTATGSLTSGGGTRRLRLEGQWGRLSHGASLDARRAGADADWAFGRLDGASRWREARSEDAADPLDVLRREQSHALGLDAGVARPSFVYERAQYVDAAMPAGRAAGARRRQWTGALEAPASAAWAWGASFERGLSDSLRAGRWVRDRDSRTARWRLGTPSLGGVRLTADGTLRRVEVPAGQDLTTRLARIDLHGRWDRVGSDWGLVYAVDSSRSEVLDRQILFVGLRQGDYDQSGAFVGYDLGDFDVVTVGTDSLVATTEVSADLSWRQDFALLGKDRLWGAWQSVTRATVRGRSRTDDVGGLLRLEPDRILDERDTVLGEISLRQDLWLLRHLRRWDLRGRFEFDEGLDRQYATHPEERLRRLHQGTLTFNVDERTSLRLRATRTDENRATREQALASNRPYDSLTTGWEIEGSRRPSPGNEAVIALDHAERRDLVSGVRQRDWGLKPQARVRFERRWTGYSELRWSWVEADEPAGALRPYFYPYPGGNVEAAARVAWTPSATLTLTCSYFGRRLGERGWQHDVRLESTARF
jgi:hypothetical protein